MSSSWLLLARSGTSYSITQTSTAVPESRSRPAPGGLDDLLPARCPQLRVDQDAQTGAVGQDLDHR